MNMLIAWIALSVVYMCWLYPHTVIITSVQSGSPAATAGLMSGIRSLILKPPDTFNAFVDKNLGQEDIFRLLFVLEKQ